MIQSNQVSLKQKNILFYIEEQEGVQEGTSVLNKIAASSNSILYDVFFQNPQKQSDKVIKMIKHEDYSHRQECNHLNREWDIMSSLDHPFILKPLSYHEDCTYQQEEHCGMILPKAEKDFLSVIIDTHHETKRSLPINVIKSHFYNISSAVMYLHQREVTHNDLKNENILFFKEDGQVKVADFGYSSQEQQQIPQRQYLQWKTRSDCNLAPEVLLFIERKGKNLICFDQKKSDVFQIGLALFQAIFLMNPFEKESSVFDPLFRYFHSRQYDKFFNQDQFKATMKILKDDQDSDQVNLQDLLKKMLEVDPAKRISGEEVFEHAWFKSI